MTQGIMEHEAKVKEHVVNAKATLQKNLETFEIVQKIEWSGLGCATSYFWTSFENCTQKVDHMMAMQGPTCTEWGSWLSSLGIACPLIIGYHLLKNL